MFQRREAGFESKTIGRIRVGRYDEAMSQLPASQRRPHPIWRALVEIAFIVFLFYSNLLMGEFIRSNGKGKTLAFALHDIFTGTNLTIALCSGLVGYVVFEFWRKKL